MRCIFFLLALAMAVPAVVADDTEPSSQGSAAPPSQQSPDPADDGSSSGNQTSQRDSCQTYQLNGFSRPITSWITPDPDGCYRRIVDNLIPPMIRAYLP